jgi:AMP nucleosidase
MLSSNDSLTGIGTEVLITCRTCCRNIENLILDILIAGCIFQANTIVEEVQVCTKLPVHGVLWLQVRVILHVVRHIRAYAVDSITDRSDTIVTQNFVEEHVQIGIASLKMIIEEKKTVKHLKFDW